MTMSHIQQNHKESSLNILPIYIAFEENVYDVTTGRNFYEPEAAYILL